MKTYHYSRAVDYIEFKALLEKLSTVDAVFEYFQDLIKKEFRNHGFKSCQVEFSYRTSKSKLLDGKDLEEFLVDFMKGVHDSLPLIFIDGTVKGDPMYKPMKGYSIKV